MEEDEIRDIVNYSSDEIQYLIEIIKSRLPESRERSLTLTKLEEALMWLERIKDES